MINRWERGRAEIDSFLAAGYLQRVKPDREIANLYIEEAKRHLVSSLRRARCR